jgi:hypothetical protein
MPSAISWPSTAGPGSSRRPPWSRVALTASCIAAHARLTTRAIDFAGRAGEAALRPAGRPARAPTGGGPRPGPRARPGVAPAHARRPRRLGVITDPEHQAVTDAHEPAVALLEARAGPFADPACRPGAGTRPGPRRSCPPASRPFRPTANRDHVPTPWCSRTIGRHHPPLCTPQPTCGRGRRP